MSIMVPRMLLSISEIKSKGAIPMPRSWSMGLPCLFNPFSYFDIPSAKLMRANTDLLACLIIFLTFLSKINESIDRPPVKPINS